jgi:hypothetical protein
MATFHRCDRCNQEISDEERTRPYIRHDKQMRLAVSLSVFGEDGRIAQDVCDHCKLAIVTQGTPSDSLIVPPLTAVDTVALSASTPLEQVQTPTPIPSTPPSVYEPSLPVWTNPAAAEAAATTEEPEKPKRRGPIKRDL